MAPPAAGDYRLVNVKTGTCLDIRGTPKLDALVVGAAVDKNNANQVWNYTDATVTHKASTFKLSIGEDAPEAEVDIVLGTAFNRRYWEFIQNVNNPNVYAIRYFQSDKNKTPLYLDMTGTRVRLFERLDTGVPDESLWTFTPPTSDPGDPSDPSDPSDPGDPDVITDGVYRIRNLGSRTLLDHYSSAAADGTAVKDFFDIDNASQNWAVATSSGTFTIVNLLTGLYLQTGNIGQPAKAGKAVARFNVTLVNKPLKGFTIKVAGTSTALQETQGYPSDGNAGTPLEVAFAASNDSINQRWWFEPLRGDQQPIKDAVVLIRGIQSQYVMWLERNTNGRIQGVSDESYRGPPALIKAAQFKPVFDKASGTYTFESVGSPGNFIGLGPGGWEDEPTPDVSYLVAVPRANAIKWFVRAHKDRTVSIVPKGHNFQLYIPGNLGPYVDIGVKAVTGDLVYACRWSIEPSTAT